MNSHFAVFPTPNLAVLDTEFPLSNEGTTATLSESRLSEYVGDLGARDQRSVRFAVACLAVYGGMKHCTAIAKLLHHTDPQVVRDAENALWRIWLRGDSPDGAPELAKAISDMRSERYSAAAQRLDRLAIEYPAFAEVHFQRGLAHQVLGHSFDAADSFKRAMQLNQHHFAAAIAFAAQLVEQEDWPRAAMFYERAFRIHPRLNGVAEAVACLRQRLAADPVIRAS